MYLEAGRPAALEASSNPRLLEQLPMELSSSLRMYMNVYKNRISTLEDKDAREVHTEETIANAIFRNNKMSDILASPEYEEIETRTKALLGDCKLGVICCIDGRLTTALMFGTSADVSKQKAAVLPTEFSADTGELVIDSSTVKIAVIKTPEKDDWNLLEVFIAHASSDAQSEDGNQPEFVSNCAAVKLIRDDELQAGREVDIDLIRANFDFLENGVEAVTRTYNSAAEMKGKPQLAKVAIRLVYDTDSMGFVLNYGENNMVATSTLTKHFSSIISGLSSIDARFQSPGALRYSFTKEDQYTANEKMMLDIIEHLMTNDDFLTNVYEACESDNGGELCGLNDSQKRGLSYIVARNVAFQYLTGLHLEHLSKKPFAEHEEEHMSISLDDGHGMIVGGLDTETQVFNAVGSRIQNAIDHIHTMSDLMEAHDSPKPFVLFVSEGIEEKVSTNEGALDAVTSKLDNTYKEIQKDPRIAKLVKDGDLIMIPVIQTSKTGRIIHVSTTPLA